MVKRKEAGWKEVLGARGEDTKERCLRVSKEEKLKGVYINARMRFIDSLEGR